MGKIPLGINHGQWWLLTLAMPDDGSIRTHAWWDRVWLSCIPLARSERNLWSWKDRRLSLLHAALTMVNGNHVERNNVNIGRISHHWSWSFAGALIVSCVEWYSLHRWWPWWSPRWQQHHRCHWLSSLPALSIESGCIMPPRGTLARRPCYFGVCIFQGVGYKDGALWAGKVNTNNSTEQIRHHLT